MEILRFSQDFAFRKCWLNQQLSLSFQQALSTTCCRCALTKCLQATFFFLIVFSHTVLSGCAGSESGDRCEDVVCAHPPANECKDGSTLLEYESTGSCNPVTGRCEYGYTERHCEKGCEDGRCPGDKVAWGWITVLESEDLLCDPHHGEWCGRIRAYFAVKPSYPRSLAHQWDFMCARGEAQNGCTLFEKCTTTRTTGTSKKTGCQDCTPDQACIPPEDGGWECRDLPTHWDAGTISIEGLKVDLDMGPDEYDRYTADGPPDDLFDDGDQITASASGGELAPFSLSTTGVAELEIDSSTVALKSGQSATISWTPADPDSRIQIVIESGWHYPFTPAAVILCDAPDSDGQVEIPSILIDGLLVGFIHSMRVSRITRYTREVKTPFGTEIELIVGSARRLELILP